MPVIQGTGPLLGWADSEGSRLSSTPSSGEEGGGRPTLRRYGKHGRLWHVHMKYSNFKPVRSTFPLSACCDTWYYMTDGDAAAVLQCLLLRTGSGFLLHLAWWVRTQMPRDVLSFSGRISSAKHVTGYSAIGTWRFPFRLPFSFTSYLLHCWLKRLRLDRLKKCDGIHPAVFLATKCTRTSIKMTLQVIWVKCLYSYWYIAMIWQSNMTIDN